MDRVIRYFDLFSEFKTNLPAFQATTKKKKHTPTFLWLLSLYLALALGVFAKGSLEWMTGKSQSVVVSWSRVMLALVTAVLAFPGAYKNSMDDCGPGFVQLCEVFVIGFGWKSLIDTGS